MEALTRQLCTGGKPAQAAIGPWGAYVTPAPSPSKGWQTAGVCLRVGAAVDPPLRKERGAQGSQDAWVFPHETRRFLECARGTQLLQPGNACSAKSVQQCRVNPAFVCARERISGLKQTRTAAPAADACSDLSPCLGSLPVRDLLFEGEP